MKNAFISFIKPFLTAIIGGASSAQGTRTWYLTIKKPGFNPPSWVFGPVWTILYTLMGISDFMVSENKSHPEYPKYLFWYHTQLVLNALWSYIFFNKHMMLGAFCELILLLIAIIMTFLSISKINKTAGLLYIPYICWVTFAGILNFSLWYLNRN